MPFSRHRSETERPESYSLCIEIIWVSIKRDFFIVFKISEYMVITDSVFGEGYSLIRDYFPKGTDFNAITAERLKEVQHQLNERSRKVQIGTFPRKSFISCAGYRPNDFYLRGWRLETTANKQGFGN